MSKKWIQLIGILCLIGLFFFQYYIESCQYNKAQIQIDDINQKITAIQTTLKDTTAHELVSLSNTKELGIELKALNQKIEATEFRIKEDFSFLLKFGIPGTIIGLVFFAWSLYKSVYQTALDNAKAEVRRSFKPKEQQIKEESKIALLTPPGNEDIEVYELLIQSGFQHVQQIKVKGYAKEDVNKNKIDLSNTDLILFNCSASEDYTDQAITTYMEQTQTAMIFKFKGENLGNSLVNNKRVASAKFTSQLYGNLINMISFKRSFYKKTQV